MERRQTRIDRLVKSLGVTLESKAVGDIIVLDDADADTSKMSGGAGAKAQEARSEEDLVITGSKPGTTVYGYRPGQSFPLKKTPEVKVGSKVFAKKSNDIWYRGVITEILQETGPAKSREFKYVDCPLCENVKVLLSWSLLSNANCFSFLPRNPLGEYYSTKGILVRGRLLE